MPRNGDGSSDNGPIEGHEIVHGTDGDKTLQHTKHVAPMPSQEQGDALPGLGAGGVAAPIPDNAEEYGTNEPRKDPVTGETIDEDQSSGNNNSSSNTRNVTSPEPARPSNKRQKTADVDVSQGKDTTSSSTGGSGAGASSGNHGHTSGDSERHDLDQVMREKAEKYVNLDEDEVNMASASTEEGKREARAERRADALGQSEHGVGQDEARRHGGHADVEELHGGVGKTSSSSASSGEAKGGIEGSAGHKQHDGGAGGEGNELEQVQRRQAEKFGVNLQDE